MQIPIASSLCYTAVVIRRPEIWGPNFYSPFLRYKQYFHENIINNDTNHKNYDATMCQSYVVPTLTVLVKKYTPCQRLVWSHYRLLGTFYIPLGFGVVLFAKVFFFLPMQFCKAVDFTPDLLYPNFMLQYFMNYSSTVPISIIFADSNC